MLWKQPLKMIGQLTMALKNYIQSKKPYQFFLANVQISTEYRKESQTQLPLQLVNRSYREISTIAILHSPGGTC